MLQGGVEIVLAGPGVVPQALLIGLLLRRRVALRLLRSQSILVALHDALVALPTRRGLGCPARLHFFLVAVLAELDALAPLLPAICRCPLPLREVLGILLQRGGLEGRPAGLVLAPLAFEPLQIGGIALHA